MVTLLIRPDFAMNRMKYTSVLLLSMLIALSGVSCSKKRESRVNFTPVPYTANPAPNSSTKKNVQIKGEAGKPQTVDIFSGKPIVKTVFTDYEGERIYFCCDVEKAEFLKNPQANMKKIKDRGIILDATPK